MKDFEKDLIYYPNPDPIEEPRFVLNSVDELEKSEKYSVICNGTERVVYHTDSFDYVVVVDNEAYDLEISIHTPFKELAIRPTSFGIEPSVKGETVHIHLDEPRKFTVETDGGLHDALFVFCSRRIEKPENTTICFEKGKAYNVGVLTLKSNDTVYIEEGAVVSGCIYAEHSENISIVGNGIVNGACWHLPDSNAHRFFIYIKWCKNVLLKGFTAVDGPSWHVVPAACDHVVIDDMNIMSRIVTGDGIDITSSQDVEVKNCFVRSTDDSICIKSQGLFKDPSTGNAIELGYALQSEIHDLVFEDCDIIHCQYEGNMGGAALSIHQADGGHVHDIHYKNIRVEQAEQKLFDIKVLLCRYTEQMAKGEIHDIYFDNIQVLNGDIPVSTIRGFQTPTEEVRVHDIHFDNITFMGEKCETWQDMRLVTELANDIYVNGVRTCKQMKF